MLLDQTVESVLDDYLDLYNYEHILVFIKSSNFTYIYEDEDVDYIPDSFLKKTIKTNPKIEYDDMSLTVTLVIQKEKKNEY